MAAARRLVRSLGGVEERALVLSYAVWPDGVPARAASRSAVRGERVARAVALRSRGWSVERIACELGVGFGSAWRLLNTYGPGDPLPRRRRPAAGSVELDERARRAAALRREGWTLARIAEELGVGHASAWQLVNVRARRLGVSVPDDVAVAGADGRVYRRRRGRGSGRGGA